MTPERYKRIDEVFQQALSQPPESRNSFLGQDCAGDEDLRREVESREIIHERTRTRTWRLVRVRSWIKDPARSP